MISNLRHLLEHVVHEGVAPAEEVAHAGLDSRAGLGEPAIHIVTELVEPVEVLRGIGLLGMLAEAPDSKGVVARDTVKRLESLVDCLNRVRPLVAGHRAARAGSKGDPGLDTTSLCVSWFSVVVSWWRSLTISASPTLRATMVK